MSDGVLASRTRASIPDIGASVPTATVHVALLALSVGLCLLVLAWPLWIVIGLLLSVAAMVLPTLVPTWWLPLLLGLSQLARAPSAADPVFYVLLAGVHLLHLLGSFARLLPWRGRIQVAALTRPLRRYLLLQLGAQSVAVGAFIALGDGRGRMQGLSIVAALVLGVVAMVLARGRWRTDVGGTRAVE